VVKDLICEFKYRQLDYVGRLLSRQMIDFVKDYRLPIEYIDYIIPVPLSGARFREREFNQALILGRLLALEFKKPLLDGILVRSRHTKRQTELPQAERLANVRNSFAVKDADRITEKNLLLVDDVLTTGATVSEAASMLKQAGARIVFVMTVAN
jgi:ComF family protein